MTIDEVIAGVPAWAGRDVQAESIEGGLTNANYRLTVGDEQFCVRIPGSDSSLLAVDRRAEYLNTLAAAEAGVGAHVRYTVGDEPVMVLEWISGEVQDEETLHRDGAVEQIAASVRRLHAGPRVRQRVRHVPDPAAVPRDLRLEPASRSRTTTTTTSRVVRRIEKAMAVQGAELVPCNNDLLAANYIARPSGFRIIDYEYAGMNDPCFELGNTVAESKLGHERLERLIELYFGAPLRNRVARAHLWAAMANYGWTLWACIQREVSDIDFDFWEWGVDDKYARAVAAFTGPELRAGSTTCSAATERFRFLVVEPAADDARQERRLRLEPERRVEASASSVCRPMCWPGTCSARCSTMAARSPAGGGSTPSRRRPGTRCRRRRRAAAPFPPRDRRRARRRRAATGRTSAAAPRATGRCRSRRRRGRPSPAPSRRRPMRSPRRTGMARAYSSNPQMPRVPRSHWSGCWASGTAQAGFACATACAVRTRTFSRAFGSFRR